MKTIMDEANVRINIRILTWHLQIDRNWKTIITYNGYHKGLRHGWFVVYKFKPFKIW